MSSYFHVAVATIPVMLRCRLAGVVVVREMVLLALVAWALVVAMRWALGQLWGLIRVL